MSERWKKKIQDDFESRVGEKERILEKHLGRGLNTLEKVAANIVAFLDIRAEDIRAVNSAKEDIIDYDLSDPVQRGRWEETKYYAYYFLVRCKIFASPNVYSPSTPSKREIGRAHV